MEEAITKAIVEGSCKQAGTDNWQEEAEEEELQSEEDRPDKQADRPNKVFRQALLHTA